MGGGRLTPGMDLRIVAVLLLVPLLDAMVLVVLAGYIGAVATVALVVLTALVGTLLVRAEGRHTLGRLRERLGRGEFPADELLDGALLLVAGAFLLTPGVVTDAIGFLLALPPTRYPVRLAVKKYVVRPYVDAKTGGFATGQVYVGGFPDEEGTPGPGPGAAAPGADETVDLEKDDHGFEDGRREE